jgi:hypothetical protein
MDLRHASRLAMYGTFAGLALGSIALLSGFHSTDLAVCAIQVFTITGFGTAVGLAVAYGPGRLLGHAGRLVARVRRLVWYVLWALLVVCPLVLMAVLVTRYVKSPTVAFPWATATADRIVVRDGGFDCCGPVDDESVLFEVTDPSEIKAVLANIEFTGTQFPCNCCGFPGIDWYRGKERLALTAVQHGKAIRWRYADLRLSEKSREWIVRWLVGHGVNEKEIEGGCGGPRRDMRRRIAEMKVAQTYLNRGEAHATKGDLDAAITDFTKALQHDSSFAPAYYARALAHEKKGDIDKAIQDFTEVIWFNRKEATTSTAEGAKVIADSNASIGFNGNLGMLYYARGHAYQKKGEKAKAEEDFAQAKKLGYTPK